jgi:hypothetical protein
MILLARPTYSCQYRLVSFIVPIHKQLYTDCPNIAAFKKLDKLKLWQLVLKYIIDPSKIADFEHYGKLWIDLVNEMGGLHHGYLLPHEGANNIGYASFSFPSLADYEIGTKFRTHQDVLKH